MTGTASDRTVTIAQAQAIAGVSRRTIYNWLGAGKLVYIRTAGGRVRIMESSLWRPGDSQPAHSNLANPC